MTRQEAINLLKGLEQSLDGYCELNEDGKKAFNMAIDALGSDNNINSKDGDLISRQAAIDAINNKMPKYPNAIRDWKNGYYIGRSEAYKIIEELPSVQPEPCEDCVSREAVIRLLHSGYHGNSMIEEVKELPSAKPEPLTDREQRIFLAAMGREEKVCEEVDRNHIREAYEDSLMWVCREIKRKVKGVLWT